MMLFLLAALIPFAFAQYQPYFSPIVPKNAQSYHPYAIQPMYGQLRRSPVHPPQVPQMPMFQPSQSQDGYYGQQFAQADGVGSDFAAYQQNAAMLQRQQVNAVPRSPYPPSMMSQQRGLPYEMPTQVSRLLYFKIFFRSYTANRKSLNLHISNLNKLHQPLHCHFQSFLKEQNHKL